MDTNTAELLFALIVAAAIVGCVWARAWAKAASDGMYYSTISLLSRAESAAVRDHFPGTAELVREANIDGWRDACRWHREQGMGVHESDLMHPYKEGN